jgi:hypothetical protein
MLGNMLLEGANYVHDVLELFFKIEQYQSKIDVFKRVFYSWTQ